MGVRGLTSYIAQRAEQYLEPFELHDCNLVIDGDNLACNLYKDVTGTYSAFGGDYDDFYRAVVNFFKVLKECNIQPFVLCDGGYEARKLRTVATRLRGKIAVIKRINPMGSVPVFPVMMKEVFIDAVRDCGVPVMRCVFEADDELAALGRKLKCPVLSYDSDFYIHNVRYIPLVTLTVKAHTKVLKEKRNEPETPRRLRKNEAKHVEKRIKAHKIINKIQVDNQEPKGSDKQKKRKSYKFLDCCVYRIENLIARRSLSKEKLPLFAALLGNDYIARSAFKDFFAVGLGKSGRSRKMNQQQKRIQVILTWLKSETVETAMQKILIRLKKDQRESLQAQVEAAISGYSNEKCVSYDFFADNFAGQLEMYPPHSEEDEELDIGDNEYEEVESEEELEESTDSEELESEDAGLVMKNIDSHTTDVSAVNEVTESDTETESDDEEENEGNVSEIESQQNDTLEENNEESVEFPNWFLEKLYPGNLPRFMVDLIHLRKYINSPQIEHFPYTECNELALPILIYIFTLINSVEGQQPKQVLTEDGSALPIEFTYLTRAVRITNIVYKHFAIEPTLIQHTFEPASPNPLLLRQIFVHTPHVDQEKLFKQINLLPSNLQLYFLAIVYWLHKSQHYDLLHLHALILSLMVLQTIDSKIPAERDIKTFQKRFGKIIKTERQVRDKETAQGIKRGIKPELEKLSIPERMTSVAKSDCYLVQNNLLKHFHMQEVFKKKFDNYSTTVLHGFAEFQAVVFQIHALNALLNFPYESPRMGQLFCGVFIYNLYDLMKGRPDRRYYVEHFLLQDSKLMFDYYCYLVDWCEPFVPQWKNEKETHETVQLQNKKALKKQRQAARKKAAAHNAQVLFDSNTESAAREMHEDEFFDLNNKFCTLLKVG